MPLPLTLDPTVHTTPARLSPRQESDLEFFRAHKAAALWHEVGVGKTHPTIFRVLELILCNSVRIRPNPDPTQPPLREMGPKKRALIVMKRSLFAQWKEKILSIVLGYAEQHPEWLGVSVGVLSGGHKPEKIWGLGYANVPDIVLTNYDYVTSLAKEEKGALTGWLAGLRPEVIVFDEAHKLKGFRGYRSPKGIRARILNRVAANCDYRLALSGSPLLNPNSSDIWALYHVLDPSIFGPTRWQFVADFFYDMSKDHKYEMLVLKPGMAAEISRRMYLIAKRTTKKDCPPGEFPEPRRIKYEVTLPEEVRLAYDELEATGITSVEGEVVTRFMLLGRLMALQQIASGFVRHGDEVKLLDCGHKMEQFEEILEEIGDAPVVVWAHFRHELEYLDKWATEKGIPHSLCYGNMSKKNFDEQVARFMDGRSRMIFGHPASVGAGMDFQRAQHSIRWSRSFTLEDFEQSDGRVNRAHSQFDETIHHEIVCVDTRDNEVYEALLAKKDLSATITLDDVVRQRRNA